VENKADEKLSLLKLNRTSFWVNPFGVAWPLLKASDLILVNAEGKVVDGGPVRLLNRAAYMSKYTSIH